jgi:O-antigen/teichoic acid export membrane protein
MRNHQAALIAYRVFSDVAGKAAFFVVIVLAARQLSPEGFGILSLGSTLGWMIAVVTDFGMQAHLARAVAREPRRARSLLERWLSVRHRTAIGGLIIAALAVAFAGKPGAFSLALLLFLVTYVVSGLVEFLHYFYRGLSRSDLESTITLWWRAAMLVCAAAALAWRPSVVTLALALLVPAVGAFVFSLHRARRLAADASDVGVANADRGGLMTELTRDVLPIGAGIVLSAVYFRVDILLIELWQGTNAVGLYNAVFRVVDAMRLFPAAVLAVALPSLCRAQTGRLLLQLATALTSVALAATIVLWFTAGSLVPFFFGDAYVQAIPAFRILLLSLPLMSLNYALTQQLIGWNGQRAYAGVCGLALVVNVGLNARLIPELSIAGAAWTTVFTEIVVTVGCGAALWAGRNRIRADELRVSAAS